MMASPDPELPRTPEKKNKSYKNPLVLLSLSHALESSLPVALSDNTPTPPVQQKKASKMKLPYLLRPLSPRSRRKSDSDDSPVSPIRWHSPHPRKRKPRVRGKGQPRSADNSPGRDQRKGSTPPFDEFETTQTLSLPGQKENRIEEGLRTLEVPTILVSPDEEDGGLVRKTSQSSHLSATSSIITSGFGSLLSPSGDEDGSYSDQDSLRSPLSSIGGSHDGINTLDDDDTFSSSPTPTDGETDYIDVDLPSPSHELHKPHVLCIPPKTTSTTTKESRQKVQRKKWAVLRKAVQWAPFVQVYRKKYPWVQLAGHQGNFTPGEENGTIMKKSTVDEAQALQKLMSDILRPFVPEFRRQITKDSEVFVEMADLLRDFDEPAVMDIKIGTRTYLEDELTKAKVKEVLRPDMYDKMITIDPNEPSPLENAQKAITKPRYMQWRETLSSTATLGFRIEGIKMPSEKPQKDDFKTVRDRAEVLHHLRNYIGNRQDIKEKFIQRLQDIQIALEHSHFFQTHEVIGSSLLFVYDSNNQPSIHIIDFGKTVPLREGISVDHRTPWNEGNHEDGYLYGLDNLIDIWKIV